MLEVTYVTPAPEARINLGGMQFMEKSDGWYFRVGVTGEWYSVTGTGPMILNQILKLDKEERDKLIVPARQFCGRCADGGKCPYHDSDRE